MDADDRLRQLWQTQPLPDIAPAQLLVQLRRHQRRLWLKRLFEAVLTAITATVFTVVPLLRPYTPAEWLLLPFFSVFLVVIWSINLRRRHRWQLAAASTRVYAGLRLAQLRDSLRELRLTHQTTMALILYALAAQAITSLQGRTPWFEAATALLAGALLAGLAGQFYTNWARRRCYREYRNLRRLRR